MVLSKSRPLTIALTVNLIYMWFLLSLKSLPVNYAVFPLDQKNITLSCTSRPIILNVSVAIHELCNSIRLRRGPCKSIKILIKQTSHWREEVNHHQSTQSSPDKSGENKKMSGEALLLILMSHHANST